MSKRPIQNNKEGLELVQRLHLQALLKIRAGSPLK
jgi:hypothetical protein